MFKINQNTIYRTGTLKTKHGKIKTPCFIPVATKGAAKLVTTDELEEMGADALISNAFLLYLRPGLGVIHDHGGLHKFMNWNKGIFTDCGGFQVMMGDGLFLNTSEKGILFKSPFGGEKHLLTPEKTIDIEESLGSDIAMALDHMPLKGCTREEAIISLKHTHKWMKECKELHKKDGQLLFGISQGSVYPDLRQKSVKFIDSLDFDGIAFGGLALGEPKEKMFEMIKLGSKNSSREKPRYVMGLGSVSDIVKAVSLGVDFFDSVWPTRNARHGQLFCSKGPINIENSKYREEYNKIDEECKCKVCKTYTLSYLHHLFRTKEPLGLRLASYHNLWFMQALMKDIRKAIDKEYFNEFMNKTKT